MYMKKIYLIALSIFIIPSVSFAGLNTLNGLSSTNQTFTNDTNFTINSSGSIHTLGWSGLLSPLRGGTGTGTAFTQGSILFAGASGVYSEDNSNLFWDDSNKILKLGPHTTIDNASNLTIKTSDVTSGPGADVNIFSGIGDDNNNAGTITLIAGKNTTDFRGGGLILAGGLPSVGGGTQLAGGDGNDGNGGNLFLLGGAVDSGNGDGGDVLIVAGDGLGTGINGKYKFAETVDYINYGILNFDSINTSDKVFTFQNTSGTLPLLESSQNFSGINTFSNPVNNFISSSNSTVHVGADGIPGCIVMGDSDSSGVTYITANDGVLSASSTPPSNCN